MKKIGIIILGILLILLIAYLFFIPKSESYLRKQIEEANYCEVDEDCIYIGDICPLGCFIHVNKNEEVRIKNLLKKFNPLCEFKCLSYIYTIRCMDNQCKL